MVFWFHAQILEYRVGPKAFHEILSLVNTVIQDVCQLPYPVVYLTMPDGVVDAVSRSCCCRQSFISDEEVKVLSPPFRMQMTTRTGASSQEGGFVRDCRPARSRAAGTACRALGSYGGGEDEGGRVVSGEPWETSVFTCPGEKSSVVPVPSFE